jgi:Big-like domain-containing protein
VSTWRPPMTRAYATLLGVGLSFAPACGTQVVEFGPAAAGAAGAPADAGRAGNAGDAGDAPRVISTFPAPAATAVALDTVLSATFSEAMDAASINATSFTLSRGSTPLSGAVAIDGATRTATFRLDAGLSPGEEYTATITTEASSAVRRALVANYSWSFDTLPLGVVTSEAAATGVPVPDYTLSVAALALLTDAHDSVQSATGAAVLTARFVTGQTYAVSSNRSLDTYGEIDAAYSAAARPLVASVPTTTPATAALPASSFELVQADLTTAGLRTLIIANTVSGVRSYQLFAVTFNPAVRSRD